MLLDPRTTIRSHTSTTTKHTNLWWWCNLNGVAEVGKGGRHDAHQAHEDLAAANDDVDEVLVPLKLVLDEVVERLDKEEDESMVILGSKEISVNGSGMAVLELGDL